LLITRSLPLQSARPKTITTEHVQAALQEVA
jgi:hypothetical protein